MKIIGFDAPHHYTTETIIFNIIDFFFNRSENMNILFPMYFYFFSFLILLFYYNINLLNLHDVIISNPLIVFKSIRYTLFRLTYHGPTLINKFTNFIITKHTIFSCIRSSLSSTYSFISWFIICGICQSERSTVSWNTNNELISWCTF